MKGKVQNLEKQIDVVYANVRNYGTPELAISFNNFYTCLRTISVATSEQMNDLTCLHETKRELRLNNESVLTELANTYIALYRASRISFIMPSAINIADPSLRESCREYRQPLIQMLLKSSRMILTKPEMSREFDRAISYYYVAPRVTYLMGPWVTGYESHDASQSQSEFRQRRLCLF